MFRKLSNKFSSYFGRHSGERNEQATPSYQEPPVPLSKARTFSQTSRADGSAYGYSGAYRQRFPSRTTLGTRRASQAGVSIRRRRETNMDGPVPSVAIGSDMNFAQRLLMANENAVTNIADLWVAAAMNADNEEVFEFGDEGVDDIIIEETDEGVIFSSTPSQPSRSNRFIRRDSQRSLANQPSSASLRPPPLDSPQRPSTSRRISSSLGVEDQPLSPRRFSTTSIPPIFSHVGVRTPPAVVEAQQLLVLTDETGDALSPISESRPASEAGQSDVMLEKEPSLMSQLPILIIIQYGLLALHSTTHDQVFYLYLVSKYPSGGLNLNAGHFSQLIALMCLFQIVYQFYFYPNIGPPRGRFSHLSMFRIGCLLFIPAYLSVILYRVFASPSNDGNLVLMAALALSTAVRFCGQTFGYTAISVLLNYMSPPHVVGYANGIAQSIVSLARFCGPVLGGLLWSTSVQNNPGGYPLGFLVCAGACGMAILHSFFIR